MARILEDSLAFCVDCAIAIANADYTGLTGARAEQVRTAVSKLYHRGYPVVGEDQGYRTVACDCCHTPLAGQRAAGSILS